MGNCGLHVGTNCLDTSGSTLDIVPQNMELCIDTSGNRINCADILIPVVAPVTACGFLSNQPDDTPDSGDTIILNIDLLARNSTCNDGSRAQDDREIAITHIIPNSNTLVSGGVLNTGDWVKVITGELIGNLCKESDAVSVCKVNNDPILGSAPTHVAFQLRRVNFSNPPTYTSPVQGDVSGVLAIPRCLYDTWQFSPGNPIKQPLSQFRVCPR
jgi:hypothetical protein